MNSEQIALTIVLVYLLVGAILWVIGLHQYGTKLYKEYLTKELGMSPAMIPFIFLVFMMMWPFFIKRGGKRE